MRVRVTFNFFLSLLVIFISNSLPYAMIFLSAATVHEVGHIVFLKLNKIKKPVLSLGLLGGCITADMSRLSYGREMAVYLGGAAFNLFACAVSFAAMRLANGEYLMFFFFANLFYAALNLLPISGLDGGRALECLLLGFCNNPFLAVKVCSFISSLFSLVTFLVFVPFVGCFKNNLTLILLLAWIVFTACFQSPPDGEPRILQQRRRLTG